MGQPNTDWVRAARQKRREAGLCVICGRNPPWRGLLSCQSCRDRHAEAARISYAKKSDRPGVTITPRLRGADRRPVHVHCGFCGERGHSTARCQHPRLAWYLENFGRDF